MANFLIPHAGAEYAAINIDQIRAIKHDVKNNLITLIFASDHSIELRGAVALQIVDVITKPAKL